MKTEKNITVLGLSYGYHDASAAIVQNGKLLAVETEERHTRQKHDSFFPEFSIEACLDKVGLTLEEIDLVTYYEKTSEKWGRVLSSSLSGWPFSAKEFKTSMKAWLGGKLWTEMSIANKLNLSEDRLESFEHHHSHAAQAFLGSEFNDAGILTIDAVGEWETCTQYEASWQLGKPVFTKKVSDRYPHSLGLFYSTITAFIGFKPMSDECSTMALAAFGTDRYLNKMRQCIGINELGRIQINEEYFNFDQYFKSPYTKKFINTFGKPASISYGMQCSQLEKLSKEEQHYADIAFAAQKIFEESVLKLAKVLRQKTSSKNLCLAGGGALNCVSNTLLLEESGFENIYIPKDPGDGGASIGAAFLGYFSKSTVSGQVKSYPVSMGREYSKTMVTDILKHLKPHKMEKYKKLGLKKNAEVKWSHFSCDEDQMLERVSRLLDQGKVVGWIQNGTENGPRSLGYRSILFKGSDLEVAKKVSTKVKQRAGFRPYALAMSLDQAGEILEVKDINQKPYRHMQLAIPVKMNQQSNLKNGLHVDGTTRPQVVYKEDNPKFYKLLKEYGECSGVEALVNTSFNESGYPMVEGPVEALLMFTRTDMDVLVIDNDVIVKG